MNDYPIRAVLSSYYFPENEARGIPGTPASLLPPTKLHQDGQSDCSKCSVTCSGCQSVPFRRVSPPFQPPLIHWFRLLIPTVVDMIIHNSINIQECIVIKPLLMQ